MTCGFLTATMIAAGILASGPASARMMGCSSAGLTKTDAAVEAMADGPNKMMMQKEIGMANSAISTGNMRQCAVHMNRVEKMMMMKPAMGGSQM